MSFNPENISILGASGAIGSAFTKLLSEKFPNASMFAFSRNGQHSIDYSREDSIAEAAELATEEKPLDLVIVANGILHDDTFMPEKSLRDLSAEKFQRIFEVNTITPTLIAKYFLPKLNKERPSIFAALSARV
ncbi:MAG: short-chain dehydrogenase, partial [Gammaproteobacteria bacterium]|nr:short-chain dehydrogenase [Gammaproteobacteria bacterium]